jgi:hypothetical protein
MLASDRFDLFRFEPFNAKLCRKAEAVMHAKRSDVVFVKVTGCLRPARSGLVQYVKGM